MDFKNNLDIFQKAADKLDKKLLAKKQIETAVGVYQDCVFLKLYKKSWANPLQDALTAETRIFFSVWVNNAPDEQKLLYNIHALKLRKLKGYSIESRKFADTFRASFKPSAQKWKNVSIKFGPLTLMQGWVTVDPGHLPDQILELANNFLEIDYLIDDALATFKV